MSWISGYRTASFRGASFYTADADSAVGRRTVRHDFPWRDIPYLEDMGRRAREFRVEGYVIGDDYMSARDRLVSACEMEGPATLVHAYWGSVTVVCTECTVRESSREGRMARIAMTFVEAGQALFPSALLDTVSAVLAAADEALGGAVEAFAGAFSVDGAAGFVAEVAGAALSSASSFIGAARSAVGDMAGYQSMLSGFSDSLPGLMESPDILGGEVVSLFSDGTGAGMTDLLAGSDFHMTRMTEMLEVSEFGGFSEISAVTPDLVQQAANQTAVSDLVRRAGLIEASRSAALTEFESYDQAVAVRDRLAEGLDLEGLSV